MSHSRGSRRMEDVEHPGRAAQVALTDGWHENSRAFDILKK